ncbi:hypothetical protein T4B_12090 [Trichinella pseudospiralis]|uniref:Retrovirus-related Pol polyprotein from transposon TNT 1-94 n=1 Tax=Trichinella pseudospiralis TaxID=6337 RepID=A0A0V1ESM2_TRIPS|nr:hypothetical protein T4A_7662 [Trichinella pseudospiralis]KRZ28893.1 hypothetical protein T4B_12090 [Trichinella pseudospiralis]KRZ40676.1 hypothetical protein T4C_4423 [Trichinella pseudospiralis]
MTPEEAWSGRKPNLAHLKVFGCLAMVHVPSGQRKKSELKSNEQKRIDVTRDVKFSESRSRFLSCHWSKEGSTNPPLNPDIGEEAMDPNPLHSLKVHANGDESIVPSPQPSAKTSPE